MTQTTNAPRKCQNCNHVALWGTPEAADALDPRNCALCDHDECGIHSGIVTSFRGPRPAVFVEAPDAPAVIIPAPVCVACSEHAAASGCEGLCPACAAELDAHLADRAAANVAAQIVADEAVTYAPDNDDDVDLLTLFAIGDVEGELLARCIRV